VKPIPFYRKGADVQMRESRRRILAAIWAVRRKRRIDRKDRGPIKLFAADFLRMADVDRKTLRAPYYRKYRVRIAGLILKAATSSLPSLLPSHPKPTDRRRRQRSSVFRHNANLASALTAARSKVAELEAKLAALSRERDELAAKGNVKLDTKAMLSASRNGKAKATA
jgi:hypothetical protein